MPFNSLKLYFGLLTCMVFLGLISCEKDPSLPEGLTPKVLAFAPGIVQKEQLLYEDQFQDTVGWQFTYDTSGAIYSNPAYAEIDSGFLFMESYEGSVDAVLDFKDVLSGSELQTDTVCLELVLDHFAGGPEVYQANNAEYLNFSWRKNAIGIKTGHYLGFREDTFEVYMHEGQYFTLKNGGKRIDEDFVSYDGNGNQKLKFSIWATPFSSSGSGYTSVRLSRLRLYSVSKKTN